MAATRRRFVSKQPGKAIWTIAAACYTAVQLPFWLLYFIPKRFRQHPDWTYQQALMNRIVRAILYHSSYVEVSTPIRLDEKEGFVRINPASDQFYRGLLDNPKIRPTVTGGTWYPNPCQVQVEGGEQTTTTVILHFHGGAYVMGEGRPSDVQFSATMLTEHLNSSVVLFPSYRLSSNQDCAFPAALQDAITAYQHLLGQGISPKRIVISGDSAGGNLAVALLRYIGDGGNHANLPSPSAALLFSPWLDIKSARDDPAKLGRNKNYKTDYVPGNFASWGAVTYIPEESLDAANNDPYFSPLLHPFHTKTPLWIQVGGLEILKDEGIGFAEAMQLKEGNKVELYIEPLANHDILYVGNLTGFAEEAKRAVKLAGEFLSQQQAAEGVKGGVTYD